MNISKGFLTIWITLMSLFLVAQNDSLKHIVENTNIDSLYIQSALDLAWNYMYVKQDSAAYFAELALMRAQTKGYQLDEASAYNTLGVVYIVKAEYYQALSYLSKGLEIGKKLLAGDSSNYSYKRRVMTINTNMGNIYYFKSKYDNAINSYLKALQLAEEIGYLEGAGITSSNLGSAYMDLHNLTKALEYNYLALSFAKTTEDTFSLSQIYNNLGSVYYSVPDYDSAQYYFLKSVNFNKLNGNKHELINIYVNLGDVMRDLGKYDSALYYYHLSTNYSLEFNSTDGLINCNYMIGQLYQKTKEFDIAAEFYKKSLNLAEVSGSQRFIMMNNEKLSEVYKDKKDYKKAYYYYTEASRMRDSIFNVESDERIADMEAKYQVEKKEEEIEALTNQSEIETINARNSRIVFISVIVILTLVIILIILSYRSFRFRQLSEKQKIQQEAERGILDAIIETENSERKRFAEDLHDGLGVMLSTLRLYINEIDNNTTQEEKTSLIHQSNAILDEAIQNARNISNNIMPASLLQNGLVKTVQAFADKINSSGRIFIEITSINVRDRLKNTMEISLFRIMTELINNTLKHAQAKKATISFTEKNKWLLITYADDGIGFDYQKITASEKGMGLDNISNRIKSLGGKYVVKSEPGKGFMIAIEIDLYRL